jgi:glycosyltransferase involved in cell wall biosynthesis
LLAWFPNLIDKTNTYTDYSVLAESIESQLRFERPDYIIRNGSYFRPIQTNVKTISLIQDVIANNLMQQQVINQSNIVVFNTTYVYNKYKHLILDTSKVRICPLGIDFTFFKPVPERHPDVLPNSILFIGASTNYPKGFNVLLYIMQHMPNQNFCLIMKDDYQLPEYLRHRVRIFNKIPQQTVRLIINSCKVAVCTSYEETQHLSGIECGACNIPIVAREVGFYHDCKDSTEWGLIATDNTFIEKLQYVMTHMSEFDPREYLIKKYSTEQCKINWTNIIGSL